MTYLASIVRWFNQRVDCCTATNVIDLPLGQQKPWDGEVPAYLHVTHCPLLGFTWPQPGLASSQFPKELRYWPSAHFINRTHTPLMIWKSALVH